MRQLFIRLGLGILCWTTWPLDPQAATTLVGNGDVGNDLEGATELKEGAILEARDEALKRLKALNVSGILGLGSLMPELKSSEIFIAKKDVLAELPSDQGSFHSNMGGNVYARTDAEPLAATRFFPIAKNLDQNQLVALHIHEALHRALDPKIREDEALVAQITLALTSPNANFDHVQKRMEKIYRDRGIKVSTESPAMALASTAPIEGRYKEPSRVGYEYRDFLGAKNTMWSPAERMHLLQSQMYPFGNDNFPLGLSLDLSAVQLGDDYLFGPLGIGAQMKAFSSRRFDVDFWTKISLQMLSDEELKKSSLGRDLIQAGVLFSKETNFIYVENRWGLMIGGDAEQKIGPVNYRYEYGSVVTAGLALGAHWGALRLGAFADLYLGNKFKISSVDNDTFEENFGRYRIISAGPQIAFKYKNIEAFGRAEFLMDQTDDADFNYVGDLLGPGVSKGYWSTGLRVYF